MKYLKNIQWSILLLVLLFAGWAGGAPAHALAAAAQRSAPASEPGEEEDLIHLIAPEFSRTSGEFSEAFELTIYDFNEPAATIKYTLDGSEPGFDNGLVYSGPILIEPGADVTVSAVSVSDNGISDMVTCVYKYVLRYPLSIRLLNKNGVSNYFISTNSIYEWSSGEKSYDVAPGEDVYFSFNLADGYKCVSISLNGEEQNADVQNLKFYMPSEPSEIVIGTTFDPNSPSDPQPGDEAMKFNLTIACNPVGAGYVEGAGKYPAGESVCVYTNENKNYKFIGWVQDGEIISTDKRFYYTMPSKDVILMASYMFDPSSPGDPQEPHLLRPLTVMASPAGGGSFSVSDNQVAEGHEYWITAYPNTGYEVKGWIVNGVPVDTDGASSINTLRGIMSAQGANVVCLFRFNPENPGSPGANYYNPETGELIIDDFKPTTLYSAMVDAIGSSDFDNVNSILVKGILGNYDMGSLTYLKNASLIDISRTSGLDFLGDYAFNYLNVASVTLPSTLSSMGRYCFYYCSNLTSITVYALEPPKCNSYTFDEFPNKSECTVFVPAGSVDLYANAEYWKDFTILPIASNAFTLQVNLPDDSADGRYKHNTLELVNAVTGVRQKYVVSDRLLYTFNGLQKDERFNLFMYSPNGLELGRIEDIVIPDHDFEVTFDTLLPLYTVTANVVTPEGENVTSAATVEWFSVLEDGSLSYLRKADSLGDVPEGQKLLCRVGLDSKLGVVYAVPEDSMFTVTEDTHDCVVTLMPFVGVMICGTVTDGDNSPLSGASVSVSQLLNGKYFKNFTAKTDRAGKWNVSVLDAPQTILTYAADECVNVTDTIGALPTGQAEVNLGTVKMKSIVGARITYGFTYHAAGEEASDYYADYKNVNVRVFNVTQNRSHDQVSLQYPLLAVLDENINEGDELRLTATSKTNDFKPVEKKVSIGENQRADVIFDIIGKGGIEASFEMTENPVVVAMLYSDKGELKKKQAYSEAKTTFSGLDDGEYTLVSMGSSDLMNSVLRLSNFEEIGLTEGRDYVKNSVQVENGKLSPVKNVTIPAFDESLFYYTTDNTGFSTNKSSITTGNYLTLRSSIDFKNVYKNRVSNVALVVDLPAECDMVDQSVIQGPNLLPYTIDNNRLTIQLGDNYKSQTRFCVVPTAGGQFNASASIVFDYDGKKVTQPIGTAVAEVKDIEIVVPSVIAGNTFQVSGTALANSEVSVFEESTLLGSGRVNAAGNWKIECELTDPYNLSNHPVHAVILTPAGMSLTSETKNVLYDRNALQVAKVTMYHYNPEMRKTYESVFDFLNPKTSPTQWIVYYPNKKFTYTIEFTSNDPARISNVVLYVHTADRRYVPVEAAYDENKGLWYADVDMGRSCDGYYPVNCSVDFDYIQNMESDRDLLDEKVENIESNRDNIEAVLQEIAGLKADSEAIENQLEATKPLIESLMSRIEAADGEVDSETLKNFYDLLGWEYDESNFVDEAGSEDSDVDTDALMEDVEELLSESTDMDEFRNAFDNLISESDSLLAFIEENTEIDEASLENYNEREFIIESEIGNYMYSEKTADEIDTDAWDPEYVSDVKLTDGSSLLVYNCNNAEIVVVDSTKNRAWILVLQPDSENPQNRPARITAEDLLNQLKKSFSKLNIAKEVISNKISDWSDALKKEMAQLNDQVAALDNQLTDELLESTKTQHQIEKLESTLKTMEKQAASGKTVYYKGEVVNFTEKIKQLKAQRMSLLKKASDHSEHISLLKSKIGSFKTKVVTKTALLGEVMGYIQIVQGIVRIIDIAQFGIRDFWAWQSLIGFILPCDDDAQAANIIKRDAENYRNKWIGGYVSACGLSIVSTGISGYMQFNKAVRFLMKTVGALVADFIQNTAIQIYTETKANSARTFNEIRQRRAKLKCKKNCGEDGKPACPERPGDDGNRGGNGGNGGSNGSGSPDDNVQIDPSGYVYEAVPENRVQGVRATIYYKETKEDMYGDPYEDIVVWNAEEYAQQNPLFTDEKGMYRWDVPQGLWQVKFEKEGYVTAYSEWLPVPPPQLDVNIGIVQNKQPEVTEARAYEEGIEVQFDKFMDPSTLNASTIYVTADGVKLNGEVQTVDSALADEFAAEEDIDATRYASRVRFVPEQPLASNAGEIRLTVSRDVLSYAGIPMTETFTQALDIEKEVQAITADDVKVLYGGAKELTIFALPSEAAAGRKLHIANSSDLILSVEPAELILDSEGKGVITIKGELPGRAQLSFTIDDVTATGDCTVDVVTELVSAEPPTASRASGTAVYRGSTITLSTDSKNATIYFTTDGTCPCDREGSRRKYTVPIVINEDTQILAVTVVGKDEDEMSETVEFNYTVKRANLDYSLNDGWTWISHNFDVPVASATLAQNDNVSRIVSQDKEVIRDPQLGLIGNLSELVASESYKVASNGAVSSVRLSDYAWNPSKPVSLSVGWNWLGYPLEQTMTLNEAFADADAETLDVIVGQSGFAQYDGENWVGTLETLVPGTGYLYQSASAKEVIFNTSIVSSAAARTAKGISRKSPLVVDICKYRDVMPVVAAVMNADGSEADNDDYLVAAFSGSECRGIGRVVNGRIMMNVYGNTGDEISFRITDAEGETEYANSAQLTFSANMTGDLFEPFMLALNGETGVGAARYEGNVRVAVDGDMLRIRGVAPEDISLVEIFDTDGSKILRQSSVADGGVRISALDHGVYVVIVKANGEYSYHKVAVN